MREVVSTHPLIVRLSSRQSLLSIRRRFSRQTAAFANNHWQGQAVDTARQLKQQLNLEEIKTYCRVVTAIQRSIALQGEIDAPHPKAERQIVEIVRENA